MNHPIRASLSLRAAAAACALGVTAFGLVGVDSMAQTRSVSPYAHFVQLERVIVTGQRPNAATQKDIVVAGAACKASARAAATSPC